MEQNLITPQLNLEKHLHPLLINLEPQERKKGSKGEKKDAGHQALYNKVIRVVREISNVIVGKGKAIEAGLITLFTHGHLLIEDVPGLGKTMLAKAFARTLGLKFSRVQFTPDLLPSDITGMSVYNQKAQEFQFKAGPVFTDILLADEINRATPRTQASLLESMGEGQVTSDGKTYKLSPLFFVIATQNPIEQQGTYILPESQLDRFMLKIDMGYPLLEQEVEILEGHLKKHPIDSLETLLTREDILKVRELVKAVFVDHSMLRYIAAIVDQTRKHKDILKGVSPRGSIALMRASQAMAFMMNMDYVEPQIIKKLASRVLTHRLILKPQALISGLSGDKVIEEILESTKVPSI